ncbi:DUF6234 family protein [Streptomyces sp. NPDC012693]
MAAVVAVGIAAGATAQRYEDRPGRPAPAVTGEAGCRSGGDSGECADTGG